MTCTFQHQICQSFDLDLISSFIRVKLLLLLFGDLNALNNRKSNRRLIQTVATNALFWPGEIRRSHDFFVQWAVDMRLFVLVLQRGCDASERMIKYKKTNQNQKGGFLMCIFCFYGLLSTLSKPRTDSRPVPDPPWPRSTALQLRRVTTVALPPNVNLWSVAVSAGKVQRTTER